MLPTLLFGVGIIPTIFLSFGLYLMKKNQDFSSVEIAVRNYKRYTTLAIFVGLGVFIYNFIQYKTERGYWSYTYEDGMWAGFWISFISYLYSLAVKFLFYNPLNSHSEWVTINGIFSSKKSKVQDENNDDPQLNIIKGEKFKQYSVADELIKWAKLKEDGHISEDEFNEVRSKLLNKN